jgi:hypothetical protein
LTTLAGVAPGAIRSGSAAADPAVITDWNATAIASTR